MSNDWVSVRYLDGKIETYNVGDQYDIGELQSIGLSDSQITLIFNKEGVKIIGITLLHNIVGYTRPETKSHSQFEIVDL
jgi:hypothetical protein